MKINKLLIATHNPGKFLEMRKHLEILNIEILSLDDLGIKEDYEEIGNTYEEIALAKAKFYYNISKIPTLADDSGLSVDALDGAPGINSKSWLGEQASDEELLEGLLNRLRDVPDQKRTAKFVSVLALVNDNEQLISKGEEYGTIAHEAITAIDKGLPYSAIFYPKGNTKVFSQLSIAEKNAISHRGRALDQIINKLK